MTDTIPKSKIPFKTLTEYTIPVNPMHKSYNNTQIEFNSQGRQDVPNLKPYSQGSEDIPNMKSCPQR
jgi:hypothetical protein